MFGIKNNQADNFFLTEIDIFSNFISVRNSLQGKDDNISICNVISMAKTTFQLDG